MPDRDFVSRHVPRPFRAAARLWIRDGSTLATLDRVKTCLALALREDGPEVQRARQAARAQGNLDDVVAREAFAARALVEAAVLAPTRSERLVGSNFAEVDSEEKTLLAALNPDFRYYASAVAAGRMPRKRPMRRPSISSVLETKVAIDVA